MGIMTAAWTAADANADGKLDLAEYIVWEESQRKRKTDNGEWMEAD